jgi:hypothetical protein
MFKKPKMRALICPKKEQLSEFLKNHPLQTMKIDPKEFIEFYFVYKKDLEELWELGYLLIQ